MCHRVSTAPSPAYVYSPPLKPDPPSLHARTLLAHLSSAGPQSHQRSKSATAAWGWNQISALPVRLQAPGYRFRFQPLLPQGATHQGSCPSGASQEDGWVLTPPLFLGECVPTVVPSNTLWGSGDGDHGLTASAPPHLMRQQWCFLMGVQGCSVLHTPSHSPHRPAHTAPPEAASAQLALVLSPGSFTEA